MFDFKTNTIVVSELRVAGVEYTLTRQFSAALDAVKDTILLCEDAGRTATALTRLGLNVWDYPLVCVSTELRRTLSTHPRHGGQSKDIRQHIVRGDLSACASRLGTDDLEELMTIAAHLHHEIGAPWEFGPMINRADYLKACVVLRERSRGLHVDTDWWSKVFSQRDQIRADLGNELLEHYPDFHLYREGSFDTSEFSRLVNHHQWDWKYTDTGSPLLSRDYLDDRLKSVPELRPFKEVRDAMNALQSIELDWDDDGYVHCGSSPFYTATSRNQPWVRDGFVMNMHPAFRTGGTIPAEDMALIAVDYSKQEPAIGIALSGDETFARLYLSGDLYETFGHTAGVDRPSAKSGVLGINYGMGLETLSAKIYADLGNVTREEAARLAKLIKESFDRECAVYNRFLDNQADIAASRGWCESVDGWVVFTSPQYSRRTQLRNFPIQSAGAAMLRRAVVTLARDTSIDIPFTLHDAIYANAPEDEAEEVGRTIAQHMDAARAYIFRNAPLDMPIAVEPAIYTRENRLHDQRGDKLLALLNQHTGE